jgi:hypothetical protein
VARRKAPLPEFDTPSPQAVASVADAIRGHGKLAPLSDEERTQRRMEQQIWHERQAWLSEKRRNDWERQQAELADTARREQVAAANETARKARIARNAEIDRQVRQREMADLRMKVTQQGWWQTRVDAAANVAARQRYNDTLMGQLDAMINPPVPSEPAQEIVYVGEDDGSPDLGTRDFNPALWTKILKH